MRGFLGISQGSARYDGDADGNGNGMHSSRLVSTALAAFISLGTVCGTQTAAKADTASTAAITLGAAAIVGALLYDNNNRPYYIRNNHRYYVTPAEAQRYRGMHHGVMRNAYVPEREYPVARDPYHGNQGHRH